MLIILVLQLILLNQVCGQIEQFATSGTYTVPTNARQIEVLVVAGGGGGGMGWEGGGGGGGGIIHKKLDVNGGDVYQVVIGAGGLPASDYYGYSPFAPSTNGGDSSFGNLVAYGGGAGAFEFVYAAINGAAKNGGCGGGGGDLITAGGQGVAGQGYDGGDGLNNGIWYAGGGGGGAGGPGLDPFHGNAGGPGYSSNISGAMQTYSGGGAGTWRLNTNQSPFTIYAGGSGGGGNGYGGCPQGNNGCYVQINPNAYYYGGGGGAVQFNGRINGGGYGYQGIVIVRVTSTLQLSVSILSASLVSSMASDYDSIGCLQPTSSVKTFLSIKVKVENVGSQDFAVNSQKLSQINCGNDLALAKAYSISFNGNIYYSHDQCCIDSALPAADSTCSNMGISAGNYHNAQLWVEVTGAATLVKGSSYNLVVTVLPQQPSVGSVSQQFEIKY